MHHLWQVAQPYFDPQHLPLPPFRLRVALAAGQMLSYGGNARFHLDAAAIAEYKEAFGTERAQFSKHYRSLIRQATAAAVALTAQKSDGSTDDGDGSTGAAAFREAAGCQEGGSIRVQDSRKRKRQ